VPVYRLRPKRRAGRTARASAPTNTSCSNRQLLRVLKRSRVIGYPVLFVLISPRTGLGMLLTAALITAGARVETVRANCFGNNDSYCRSLFS